MTEAGAFDTPPRGVAWELVARVDLPRDSATRRSSLAAAFNGSGPTVGDFVDVTAVGGLQACPDW